MLWVVTYSMPGLFWLHRRWPHLQLSVYLDDLVLGCEGTFQHVSETLVEASGDLNAMIQDEETGFGASVAMEKLAVAASSRQLANAVRRGLGAWAGRVPATADAATNLGIDFLSGARRGAVNLATLKKRKGKARLRCRRLMKVRSWLPAGKGRVGRIFLAGLRPQVGFGSKVNGVSTTELKSLQSQLSRGFPPGAGASLSLKLAVMGDPAAGIEVGPLLQLHLEAWKSAAGMPHSIGLRELQRRWRLAQPWAVKDWKKVRGPLGAAALTFKRLDWQVKEESPLSVISDRGDEIVLLEHSPKLIKAMVMESVQRQKERKAAAKLKLPWQGGEAPRVLVDPVCSFLRSTKKTPVQKGTIRSVACGRSC